MQCLVCRACAVRCRADVLTRPAPALPPPCPRPLPSTHPLVVLGREAEVSAVGTLSTLSAPATSLVLPHCPRTIPAPCAGHPPPAGPQHSESAAACVLGPGAGPACCKSMRWGEPRRCECRQQRGYSGYSGT